MEYKDPGKYIPIIYLLNSWGSRFGVPSRVPLNEPGSSPCSAQRLGLPNQAALAGSAARLGRNKRASESFPRL